MSMYQNELFCCRLNCRALLHVTSPGRDEASGEKESCLSARTVGKDEYRRKKYFNFMVSMIIFPVELERAVYSRQPQHRDDVNVSSRTQKYGTYCMLSVGVFLTTMFPMLTLMIYVQVICKLRNRQNEIETLRENAVV